MVIKMLKYIWFNALLKTNENRDGKCMLNKSVATVNL